MAEKTRKTYAEEDKQTILKELDHSSMAEVSKQYNVSVTTLMNWKKKEPGNAGPVSDLDFLYMLALQEPGAKEVLVEWFKKKRLK